MRYRISHEASMDLARIYWHGAAKFGEQQAERYYQLLIEQFEKISNAPLAFQSVNNIREGYRRSVCGADSIYYRISNQDGAVEIMRILGRQDLSENL
ncbi:type II toxin-antitoxin system RelE/ParE family toxin [Cellvibrio sp. KY-YJ-3]|uniref:type II toxin-antitoxin system RelE/ParE family toxin n=1 Tax=Cellvibrio sp. KY-YJ-3 TaxID=454662 RepID=UPI0012470FD9|nr:type II toxin-antitoxin system RelE/ParE family toxin [Cellvibrio sp. KY-YJ-3]QEY11999.1 type II toxin-antitoxin system RelE/ParE family toxin [Cellvibrio sp. KY-YJ-3]